MTDWVTPLSLVTIATQKYYPTACCSGSPVRYTAILDTRGVSPGPGYCTWFPNINTIWISQLCYVTFLNVGQNTSPIYVPPIGKMLWNVCDLQTRCRHLPVLVHRLHALFVYDIQQILSRLHNLYKFQWTITSCLSNIKYCPEWPHLVTLWWQMWRQISCSNVLQFPSKCHYDKLMSQCLEGGFR